MRWAAAHAQHVRRTGGPQVPFSATTKLEAKSLANYTCCWCRRSGTPLHVHHIVPEAEGGDSELDNAAPLCPTCHTAFGHNPEFRGDMRARRNDWNERCAKVLEAADPKVLAQLGDVESRMQALEEAQQLTAVDVKQALSDLAQLLPSSLETAGERATSGAVLAATMSLTATSMGYVIAPMPVARLAVRLAESTPGQRRMVIRNLGPDVRDLDVTVLDSGNLLIGDGQLPLRQLRAGGVAEFAVAWASSGERQVDVSVTARNEDGSAFTQTDSLQIPW